MNPKSDRSAEDIRRRAERMQRARREPGASPLRGLGAFGMIGWSIAVPTVAGAFLGLWLDRVAPQDFSWPIALILGGVVIGGIIAWSWIGKEIAQQQDQSKQGQYKDANNEGEGR
jgi:ATP synthase protein I